MYNIHAKSAAQAAIAEHSLKAAGIVAGDYPGETVPYDEAAAIIAFEQGDLSADGVYELFQHLLDNGHAWMLQGSYGRHAKSLIEGGYCHA